MPVGIVKVAEVPVVLTSIVAIGVELTVWNVGKAAAPLLVRTCPEVPTLAID
jgi:hypothetical protein